MSFPYFTESQIFPLFFAVFFIIASIVLFQFEKKNISLIFLFLGSLFLGYFIAHLDPFLRLWDEQFHALVAKNMLKNPLKPTMYFDPVMDYDYKNWSGNFVWLHKQPLFLWQIAISLKIFGLNEIAVRIPSIIMHAFAALMIYRIGKISCNKNTGYYAALFFTVAYYPLGLIAGNYATDHNDVAFLYYITASFWAWFEYQNSHKKYWIILIGVFAGSAVLVKWLVGLLIYAVWFISLGIEDKKQWFNGKNYLPILGSFLITLLVFLPWQIFILAQYPNEANYEFAYNTKHFFEVIEEHGGSFWYHIQQISELYGPGKAVPFVLLFGLIVLFVKSNSKKYAVAIISAIFIVYLFYSLAATKMPSFCIIVSPLIFIGLGSFADSIFNFINHLIKSKTLQKIVVSVLSITLCFSLLDLNKIEKNHTFREEGKAYNRNIDLKEMQEIKEIKNILGEGKYVIFRKSPKDFSHIPMMFYTDYIAYDFMPDENNIERIKKKNEYKIVIIDNGELPEFISNDKDVKIIKIP